MSRLYRVRKGTHVGRGHLIGFTNRQDAVAVFDGEIEGEQILVGVICDGCSEGTASETGATLASTFLVREVVQLRRWGVPVEKMADLLYANLVNFLKQILSQYYFFDEVDRVNFIQNHLLFTVVAFIITDEVTITLLTGDGVIIINDQINFAESGNKPLYPGYHLVDREVLEQSVSKLPTGFEVNYYATKEIDRLAIGSDAWKDENELLKEVFGIKNPSGLQRRINQWSKAKRFYDDVTIITVETEAEDLNGYLD